MVTHQLQVERRTAKAHRPKTNALPLDHAANWTSRLIHGSLCPTESHDRDRQTHRQRDHACYHVCDNRPHYNTVQERLKSVCTSVKSRITTRKQIICKVSDYFSVSYQVKYVKLTFLVQHSTVYCLQCIKHYRLIG